ncbi:hypothetical protein [Aeromicrobium piscarium]|uniref:Glycosyltransferase RgtA/B/C/D-like domain-containing protein n=1 Tax=Aeromicrobium piscarium TaxID=2590901 RepID=A0A554RX40_9ACTN|nr:hypothetical protein [Aeromicrobium piscarium]TSD58635.1 hypothetical protein FNM00_14175 [Aeromicrobium piscarium]
MTRPRLLLVALAIVVAAATRLPRLSHPLTPDEAGFLIVGRGWSSAGAQLYGAQWVDRPPVLIAIFRFAEQAGGLYALRLIGVLAAALTVLLAARVAVRIAGGSAAVPAAWAAALMVATPVVANGRVDGELLAAPFVLAGLSAAVAALAPEISARQVLIRASLAGVAGLTAMMIKQNFVDVAVFAAVAGLVALLRREIDWPRARLLVVGFVGGAAAALAVILLWSWSRGTSPIELYEALYPFRIEASRAIDEGAAAVIERRSALRLALVLGGAVPLTVIALPLLWRRGTAAVWGMVAVVAFGLFSVAAGGSAWLHYLVQLCGPVAVLTGVAAATYRIRGRLAIAAGLILVLVAGVVTQIELPDRPTQLTRERSGEAIAAVSDPGDSIVVFPYGANIAYASGLDTPYPYLWMLPAIVRDTDLSTLGGLIRGENPPTWLVLTTQPDRWPNYGLTGPTDLLDERYAEVGELCGRPVYLMRDADRAAPVDPCA